MGKVSGKVCVIVGILIWILGIGFAVMLGTATETENPSWDDQPPPDCYIGLQTVILAMFLPMLCFSIVGSVFVLSGLNALLRS